MAVYRKYRTNARGAAAFDGGTAVRNQIPHGTLRAVECPDCLSPPRTACRSNTGKELAQVHISRRRIAMRKYNAEREQADG